MDHSTTERMAENLLPYFNNSLKFSDSIINAKDDLHVLSSRLILLVFIYTTIHVLKCATTHVLKSKMFVNIVIPIRIDKS